MSTALITYDLRKPGQNYQPLWDRLEALGAVRALESVWVLKTAASAAAIRDDLLRFIDANDRLLVAIITSAAWHNLIGQSGQTLKRMLEG
jgi:hypothetical protein